VTDFLFDRKATLIVDDRMITQDLRLTFKICKTSAKEPNTAKIEAYNLSEATRGKMKERGAKIILQAGYPGTLATIFSGVARTIDHLHQGPEWVTEIQCGDGEQTFRVDRINESFKGGTFVEDIVKKVISKMNVSKGNVDLKAGLLSGQLVHGFTAKGYAADELTKLLEAQGLEWSIQDGAIQILKANETTADAAVLLSPTTGLIGDPVHSAPDAKGKKPTYLKIKALLTPRAKPGARVALDSTPVKGVYRCEKVEHTGDTSGGPWYSEIEAIPVPGARFTS
jgi:hypothetical protein